MNSTEVLEINVIKQRKEQYVRESRKEIEILKQTNKKKQIKMKKAQQVNKQTNHYVKHHHLIRQSRRKKSIRIDVRIHETVYSNICKKHKNKSIYEPWSAIIRPN